MGCGLLRDQGGSWLLCQQQSEGLGLRSTLLASGLPERHSLEVSTPQVRHRGRDVQGRGEGACSLSNAERCPQQLWLCGCILASRPEQSSQSEAPPPLACLTAAPPPPPPPQSQSAAPQLDPSTHPVDSDLRRRLPTLKASRRHSRWHVSSSLLAAVAAAACRSPAGT